MIPSTKYMKNGTQESVSPHGSLARGNICNLGFQTLQ